MVTNIKKTRRLMRKYGLKCPVRKANPCRRMAKALKTSHAAPNLLNRGLRPTAPGPSCSPISLTSPTARPPPLSVHHHRRLHERAAGLGAERVLSGGFHAGDREPADGAPWRILTNPSPNPHRPGGPLHQREVCPVIKDSRLRQSMSRRVNCWDNVPQESFFGHRKNEIDLSGCTCFAQIHEVIRAWTEL